MKILASIVGVVLYFVLAWAIKDILLTGDYEWVGNMSFLLFELLCAALAATIASGVAAAINVEDIGGLGMALYGIVVFGINALVFTYIIPVSEGSIIIFNLINIGGIVFAAIMDD